MNKLGERTTFCEKYSFGRLQKGYPATCFFGRPLKAYLRRSAIAISPFLFSHQHCCPSATGKHHHKAAEMMIYVDPSRPTSNRRACDRCHISKLKCIRDDDSPTCRRCQDSSSECVYSPAERPGQSPRNQGKQSVRAATMTKRRDTSNRRSGRSAIGPDVNLPSPDESNGKVSAGKQRRVIFC